MNTQHTKGPWRDHGTHIEGVDGELIAAVTTYGTATPRQKANARLIAAAPELLEALQLVLAEFCKDGHGGDFEDGEHPYVDKARAAIAKATGQ